MDLLIILIMSVVQCLSVAWAICYALQSFL